MTEKVLEPRVKRLELKLDQAIEQDHERLTRLEDVLANFIRTTQDGFVNVQKQMVESQQRNDAESAKLHQEMVASSAKLHQEMAASQQRNDAEFAKLHQEMVASSAKLHQEMAASQQRNDAESAKLHQEMAASQQRNDAGFAKLRQELGNLSHRLGSMVEDLVAPSLPRILTEVVHCPDENDIAVNTRIRRRHPTQTGKMLEIDAIADCANYVLFNETKSQLTPEKVKDFLEKLAMVHDYFPEYQHHTILGAVSSLRVEASLVEYASRQGLLVLGGVTG